MKRIKKVFLVAALGLTVSLGTANVYAETMNVGGGTWNYGYTKGINAYSKYYHSYNNHGSKVVNVNNGITAVSNAQSGIWSNAVIGTIWDPATFYYNPTEYY